MNMMKVFKPGDEIDGYCGGRFGDYDDKVCVLATPKYAVFQNRDGDGSVLNYYYGIEGDFERGKFTDK